MKRGLEIEEQQPKHQKLVRRITYARHTSEQWDYHNFKKTMVSIIERAIEKKGVCISNFGHPVISVDDFICMLHFEQPEDDKFQLARISFGKHQLTPFICWLLYNFDLMELHAEECVYVTYHLDQPPFSNRYTVHADCSVSMEPGWGVSNGHLKWFTELHNETRPTAMLRNFKTEVKLPIQQLVCYIHIAFNCSIGIVESLFGCGRGPMIPEMFGDRGNRIDADLLLWNIQEDDIKQYKT
jgi:hypothetical protein